jgi:hypothetical protein
MALGLHMNTALHGIDQKVARAKNHRDYLTRRVTLFQQRSTHRVVTTVEAEGLEHVVRIHRLQPVPPEWAVILGEFLYDLRPALDNLMWALILANGKQPGRDTYFPVLHRENDKTFTRMTAGAGADAIAIIRSVQPYLKGDRARADPFFLLHELNRLDKHRSLTVVTMVANQGEFYVPAELAGRCTVRTTLQPLHDGAEVLRYILTEPQSQVDVRPRVSLAVWIMETETTPYLSFPGDLDHIYRAAIDVIQRLRSCT